jgi:uncharacterized protein (DUF1501 family)
MLGAAATLTLPVFLQKTFAALDEQAAGSVVQTPNGKDGPILVILQLAGGNDGLNTVIPYADDAYYRARPAIGIAKQSILQVNDYIGLHPKLSGLKSLYDSGHLGIVQGVGYPNPNRSHFRSTEIWQTASDANVMEQYGWVGRYFDSCCKGADPTVGVAVSNAMPQAFVAKSPTGVSFQRPEQYKWQNEGKDMAVDDAFHHLNQPATDEGGSSIGMVGNANTSELNPLDYLQRTALDAQLSSAKILEISRKYKSSVDYPKNQLGSSLSLIAQMIAGGLPTRVYYASQGGYDTHNNQLGTHDRLMTELGDSLAAFAKDLQQQGNFNRVLLMTFSEFGRRVVQNGSNGTDHGAAGPMFLMGGAMKAGLYGKYPSLTELHDNDLIFNTDFRSVYATVLDRWLKAPSKTILGRQFQPLNIV